MPVPLLVPIIAGLGGAIAGALARQPEINQLKQQVKTLQAEITRLQGVIKEQDRQIKELKIRYNSLKAYHFIEKVKQKSKVKGALTFQYAFNEYMDLLVAQARNESYALSQEERLFFNIFERLTSNQEITVEEKMVLREYVRDKYKYEIEHLIQPDSGNIVEKVESIRVA